jgi:ABC-2 type transport system ATP-binding protein
MIHSFLRINKLSKNYLTSDRRIKHALTNVSLAINSGEIFGLLGVNGAGKTTLSSIIATLQPPTSGAIMVHHPNGNFVSIYDDLMGYRRQLGFCAQKSNLMDTLSVQENLVFAGTYYGQSKEQALVRAEELMATYNLGEFKHQTPAELSGGYRQRVMIARALMHKPRLVLLDEPTVGLDPHIRLQLWEEIRTLKESGVTVLLTTHYLDEAEVLCDRVCILHNGAVRLIGTPNDLKSTYQRGRLEDVFIALMEEDDKPADELAKSHIDAIDKV